MSIVRPIEKVFWEKVNYSAGLKYGRHLIEKIFSDEEILNKSVIDIGCGIGSYSLIFKEKGARTVIGVDFSESSIDVARQELEKTGFKNVQFLNTDIRTHNFQKESFELVMCRGVIYYISNPYEVIERLCELVQQNGILFISFIKDTSYAKIINSIRRILYHMPKASQDISSLLISLIFFSILFVFYKETDFHRIRAKVLGQYYPVMNYFLVKEALEFFCERGFKVEKIMHSLDIYGTEFGLKLRRVN